MKKEGSQEDMPLRRKLGVQLVKTFYGLYDSSQLFFAEFELTSQQYNVLKTLYDTNKPMTTSSILEHMVEKNAGVSRLVDRLVVKGLVVKTTNTSDKRLIDVSLTQNGRSHCELVNKNLQHVDELYDALTDEEVVEMMRLLRKLRMHKVD